MEITIILSGIVALAIIVIYFSCLQKNDTDALCAEIRSRTEAKGTTMSKPTMTGVSIEQHCERLRQRLGAVCDEIVAMKRALRPELGGAELPKEADRGEMIANVTLAQRHIEDARMRLGKAMQAYQGGVSILDRPAEEMAEIQKCVKGE